ncbi:pinin [Anopheles ziemanni]|uniref:pinin n=1 Tax=Anopheles coustani TaxID=139045 RepID=UPI002658819D|nr:pinin [Anopheles coustani]XP_058172095.1 pinin [Anopheles ziemanni]
MEAEIMTDYNDLQKELDRARSNLKGLNESIRRIIGREPSGAEQYNNARGGQLGIGGGGPGGGNNVGAWDNFESRKRNSMAFETPSMAGQRREQERRYSDIGTQNPAKRRSFGETKSVFSRLSGPPNRDAEYEKPRIFSRVIKEQPSKEDIVAAQGTDERSRARNRRIFGSLLGTLQKFSQEESKLKSKEEKKALIERKVEEQEKKEREHMRKEKQCLFIDRKRQQLEIRALEAKVAKLKDLETWEKSKRPLRNFIKTKSNPPIFFLPKRMNAAMGKKLEECQQEHQIMMEQKQQEVKESIEAIEVRVKADIITLEENGTRARNNSSFDKSMDSSKASGNVESNVGGRTGTKLDRIKMELDDEDEDHNTAYAHYEYEDQCDVPEGPALPASMASRFKITIQNVQVKTEPQESLHTPSAKPKTVRLLSSERLDEGEASRSGLDNDSDSRESHSVANLGKTIQITFRTSHPDDN